MNLNVTFIIGLSSTLIAQIIKVIVVFVSERRVAWDMLSSTGGMPSSHSAGVVACATSVGFIDGWSSTTFAIASALALVVMYDATGIRRAAGVHAEYLNQLAEEFSHIFKQDGKEHKALKTLLGHTYLQVFFGCLQGVAVAYITHMFILK